MSVKRLPPPAPPQPFQPINKAPRLFEPTSQETHKMLAFYCSTPSSTVSLALSLGHDALTLSPPSSAFTFFQMQEFHHQALIYKYMASGLPVPFHLVLPIWKSVASFMECSSELCFDYRNLMEPEPGRCRRTDGKKWRCSRNVMPDQKYCDRHIHRGRRRSRKPVEGTTTATATTTTRVSASVLDETRTIPNTHNGKSNTGNRTESSSCFGFSPVGCQCSSKLKQKRQEHPSSSSCCFMFN